MSKNNLLKKSEKKFIRMEKARIRRQFLDFQKQEELINLLYKRFLVKSEPKADLKPAPEDIVKTKIAKSESKTSKGEKIKKNKKVQPVK